MPIHPYLNFAGNTREVVEFYARVFKSPPPYIMTFGEMPPDPNYTPPAETKNLIMHAAIHIGGSTLMFSDVTPGMPYTQGNNISLTFVTKDRDELVRCYNAMKEGGQVQMELQETFWSKAYGMVTDKYGIPWQFSLDSGEMSA
jgi:PhnB protein